jgi:hypothetical protein
MRGVMQDHTWTITEAKAKLSEILRLASEEGPQRIGSRTSYIIIPEEVWKEQVDKRKPAGQWLVENMSQGVELELPDRKENSGRDIPFSGEKM